MVACRSAPARPFTLQMLVLSNKQCSAPEEMPGMSKLLKNADWSVAARLRQVPARGASRR